MILTPITLREANAFVEQHHRHHTPVVGQKFSLGAAVDDEIVAVAIVSRPVARGYDDGWTLEITRLCTDGTRNAGSFLLGACRKAARALGYKRLITYTFQEEGGASLRGAGYRCEGLTKGGNWNTPARPRVDTEHQQQKLRWNADL